MLKKGFTLIELLIVITIIGILAVAILSAINPIEQINRASDSRSESDSAELLNAVERYFTSTFNYPWGTIPNQQQASTAAAQDWMQELVENGEVKKEFLRRSTWDSVYVTQGAGQLVSVCFLPRSTDYQNQAEDSNQKRDGSLGCSGTSDVASSCHVCLPR